MAASATLLLRRDGRSPDAPVVDTEQDERTGRRRVRCPRCGWEPGPADRWMCSCLHVWNTFETGGTCPACARSWAETQCPRCNGWSRHEDWYVDEADPS